MRANQLVLGTSAGTWNSNASRRPRHVSGPSSLGKPSISVAPLAAQTLRDPPEVSLGIERPVASIGPMALAVVVDLGLVDDLRARGPRPRAVGVHVVHVDHHALGVARRRKGALHVGAQARRIGPGALA